ncbi:MAG: V-type ATP synthase subunit F [Planctomycetota bacterium]|jgi:V/A-type H+-transporting ATPase subunit F
MEFYVIADRDTVQGFRYAGITGAVAESADEAASELNRLAEREAELIVIMTERTANSIRETVNAIRFGEALPLIVEIPGPLGPDEESRSLLSLIREALGIKI